MAIMSSRARSARPAGRRFTRPRSAAVALAAATVGLLVGLSLLVTGCGGSPAVGVAQIPSTTTSTNAASPSGSTSGGPAAYSACMRKNGVPTFPDPQKDGGLLLRAGPGTGIEPNSAQFKAAERACQKLRPEGKAPSPQQQAKDLQKMLEFSRCMRSHGVPGFPDPKASGGGIQLSIGKDAGVDPNSSQFKAAQQTCQKLMPGPKDGKGGPTGPVFGAGPSTSRSQGRP
jgi:hypothetical protein